MSSFKLTWSNPSYFSEDFDFDVLNDDSSLNPCGPITYEITRWYPSGFDWDKVSINQNTGAFTIIDSSVIPDTDNGDDAQLFGANFNVNA